MSRFETGEEGFDGIDERIKKIADAIMSNFKIECDFEMPPDVDKDLLRTIFRTRVICGLYAMYARGSLDGALDLEGFVVTLGDPLPLPEESSE